MWLLTLSMPILDPVCINKPKDSYNSRYNITVHSNGTLTFPLYHAHSWDQIFALHVTSIYVWHICWHIHHTYASLKLMIWIKQEMDSEIIWDFISLIISESIRNYARHISQHICYTKKLVTYAAHINDSRYVDHSA